MSYRLLFILGLFMATLQVQAAAPNTDNRFYDKSTEHFTAYVGMMSTRSGYIHFADAELPPDPNQPVVMSYGFNVGVIGDFSSDDIYSYSIVGADADMFSAAITSVSASENGCTVRITYRPTAVGTHTARLNVYCSNAGAPLTYINLSGEAVSKPGDVDGDGNIGISDVSRLIDLLLRGE